MGRVDCLNGQVNHPEAASCVVGVPDERTGERVKAYVVLKEDIKGITGYELIRWCRERLAPYKVPQYIEFRDMLPKSKVGKLLRREIRDEKRRRGETTQSLLTIPNHIHYFLFQGF